MGKSCTNFCLRTPWGMKTFLTQVSETRPTDGKGPRGTLQDYLLVVVVCTIDQGEGDK